LGVNPNPSNPNPSPNPNPNPSNITNPRSIPRVKLLFEERAACKGDGLAGWQISWLGKQAACKEDGLAVASFAVVLLTEVHYVFTGQRLCDVIDAVTAFMVSTGANYIFTGQRLGVR
jgi:hypothetical protein